MVRISWPILLHMKTLPSWEPEKPRDMRYSWRMTLKTPFPRPLRAVAERKRLAGVEIRWGIYVDKSIIFIRPLMN
jgi:hypothetical protein